MDAPGALVAAPQTPVDEDFTGEFARPAVWEDSDDERLTVSLAGHQRLRKLRLTESEDLINGKEYVRRLRRQYLRLHPTPNWANPNFIGKERKRAGSMDSDDDFSGVDEMDTDDDTELSAQPLAKLLRSAGDLIRENEDNTVGGTRKLRQEVIDIQRLKDVGGNQPVSTSSIATKSCFKVQSD